MYLITYILFCLLISFVIASIFGRKFEEAVISVQFGIVVFLYIFYVFDILSIGFCAMSALFVMSFVFAIYRTVKWRRYKDVMKLMFRPTTLIFVVLLLLIVLTVRDNTVSLIDELHLWAVLPKILFYQNGKLQLCYKEAMMLGFSDYIPGMPLYLYFIERLGGGFQESLLYFGYAAIGALMLLQMCGRMSGYRKWYMFLVVIIILYALPLTFYNATNNDHAIYYKSLHVDAIIGVTVGYAMWLLIQKPWKDISSVIFFSLCLAWLVLLKSSGIVFVGTILVSMLLYLFMYDRTVLKKWYVWTGTAIPVVMYIMWKFSQLVYSAGDTIEYVVSDIINLEFIKIFITELLTKSVLWPRNVELSKYCTFATLLICLFALCISWYFIVEKQMGEKKRLVKWCFATLLVQIFIFVAGLYGLCVGPFDSGMPSYGRYICTMLTAVLCFLCMNVVYDIDAFIIGVAQKSMSCKIGRLVFIVNILFIVFNYPLYAPVQIQYPRIALNDADKIERIIDDVSVLDKTFSGRKRAAIVVDREYNSFSSDLSGYLHRRLYFNLIDENIQIDSKVFFSDEIMDEEGMDGVKVVIIPQMSEWIECDYIYQIHYVDDTFKTIELFDVKGIEGDTIYLRSIGQYDIK